MAIGITILVGFFLFRCLMDYCARCKVIKAEKEQRMVRWLEEKVKRDRHPSLEMSEDSCSKNHLHIPKNLRMAQIESAPPSEVTLPESGVFEQTGTPSKVSFHA